MYDKIDVPQSSCSKMCYKKVYKQGRAWYITDSKRNNMSTCSQKESPGMAVPGFSLWAGLCLLISIQPLAYVVSYHTCQHGDNKRNNIKHLLTSSLLEATQQLYYNRSARHRQP